jgi:hypothetical protein
MKKLTINIILLAWLGTGLYLLFPMLLSPMGLPGDSWGVKRFVSTWIYLLVFIFPSSIMLLKINLEKRNFVLSAGAKFVWLMVIGLFILGALFLLN